MQIKSLAPQWDETSEVDEMKEVASQREEEGAYFALAFDRYEEAVAPF